MKKLLLVFCLLLAVNSCSYAACEYECTAPYDMNNKFKAFLSVTSGTNFVTEKAAEKAIKKSFSKTAPNENLKVKLDSYSAKDLKNGIFKSINISGDSINVNDIYLSHLDMNTLCDFNYIKPSGDDYIFMTDFPMAFNIEMTATDINKTMQSKKYQRLIDDLNKIGSSVGKGIKISSTRVSIRARKFYYIIGITIPFIRSEQKLVVTSDLRVQNGKIDFTNTQLVSKSFKIDLEKVDFIWNYLNPLDFSVNIFEDKDAKVSVKNVKIVDNKIVTDGIVVIPKD